jgi:poly-gamma-glutamate capsule biosynthesis protein CapA/YwtB (metallophosphatase superfamily)
MGTGILAAAKRRLGPWLLGVSLAAMAAVLGADSTPQGTSAAPDPDLSAYPWFYLRDGQPLAPDEVLVELVAVGDVMPGRGVAGVESPLAQAAPWLQAADLALGNLEAPLVEATPSPAVAAKPAPYLLVAAPPAAPLLAGAGFDLLSLANNHGLDAGSAGLEETAGHLQQAGIGLPGAGPGVGAYVPVIREVRGVRLAFLAFNAVAEPGEPPPAGNWTRAEWDEARAVAAVQAAHNEAHAVIVSIHWGYEYEVRPDPYQIRIAKLLAETGAALVLGHHPHVVQPVAVEPGVQETVVAYSLGNFLFDQEQDETRQGLALRAFFDEAGLRAVQALPIAAGLQPQLVPGREAESLLARAAPAHQLVFSCSDIGCSQVSPTENSPAAALSGLFWSGELDLTGDGEPELVRRAAGQVSIYDGGAVVWQSPPEWHVVDLALGDPNDDGRGELLLALRRVGEDGHERSQPYIAGYRGGAYQLLWGGRAVAAPILEVELGDVDGDGAEELIVLEELPDGAALSVWRWQGWSFSLVWRSEPGAYRNLTLQSGSGQLRLVVEAAR